MTVTELAPIEKAGGVVVRRQAGELELYLVHRPRYDDWSVPKGHIDEGETPEAAALRELTEETGFECRLLRALPAYEYLLPDGQLVLVHMFEVEPQAVAGQRDDEVDEGRWVSVREVATWVSYPSLVAYLQGLYPH